MIKSVFSMNANECFAIMAIQEAMGTVPTQVNGLDMLTPEEIKEIKEIAYKFCVKMMNESFRVQESAISQFWGI